jgi:two-component system, cell cycle response regulator
MMSDSELEKKTRIADIKPRAAGSDLADVHDILVFIYTSEQSLLGKRFVLEGQTIRVGRSDSQQIVLHDDSVSRGHMHFERRGAWWYAVDDGSTNGTYVNEERIAERCLGDGDRIAVGKTILKYLCGGNVEARYHEEIYRLTVIDGLTQLHNKRFLLESLDQEIGRARRHGSVLSVLMIDIDHFRRFNDANGHATGDRALRQIGSVLRETAPQTSIVARYGGEEFVVVLENTTLESAHEVGERLRQAIEASTLTFENETAQVTVSVGGATLNSTDDDAAALLKRAEHAGYAAKREGRNRVVCGPGVEYRPVLDGASLVQKMRTRAQGCGLLAFEIEAEVAIVEELGVHAFEEWLRQLVRIVELNTEPGAHLATWHSRYVLVAVPAEVVGAVVDQVTTQWKDRSIPEAQRCVERRVRHAFLPPDDFARLGDRALAVIGGRLLQSPGGDAVPEDELPFPIASLRSMVLMRRTTVGRVMSLLDGIEVALRFACALELAMLGDCGDEVCKQAAEIVVAHELSGLPWETVALDLASLASASPQRTLAVVATSLAAISRSESLASTARDTLRLRELIGEEAGVSEDAHAGDEARLRELFDALVLAFRPLSKSRLVSVAEIETVEEDEDEGFGYALRVHRGSGEQFPIISGRVRGRLVKNWCYLLPEPGTSSPLCLAPLVASRTCDECGRIEVATAETLSWDEKGAEVQVRGVTTKHPTLATVPAFSKGRAALRSSVLAIRLRRSNEARATAARGQAVTVVAPRNRDAEYAVTGQFRAPRLQQVTVAVNQSQELRILFLAANPVSTPRLDLEEELRVLEHELETVKHRDRIALLAKHAVVPDDLLRHVRRFRPNVVHFSGHGTIPGIILRDDAGSHQPVSGPTLQAFLSGRGVELVVLNACYSMAQAADIAASVPAVIGTTSAVGDLAARRFSAAFHRTLGDGFSIAEAFRDGRDAVALHGLTDVFHSEGDLSRVLLSPR